MNNERPAERLAQFRKDMDTRRAALETRLDSRRSRQKELERQLHALQVRIQTEVERQQATEAELADFRLQQLLQETELARELLEESHTSLLRVNDYLTRREEFQERWDVAVREDPQAEAALRRYREFARELQSFRDDDRYPALRQRLLDDFQGDRERLAPLLKLEKERESLKYEETALLTCILAADSETNSVICILPVHSQQGVSTPQLSDLRHSMEARLSAGTEAKSRSSWQGFHTISVYLENSFKEYISLVTGSLTASPSVAGFPDEVTVAVEILEVPYEVWLIGEGEQVSAQRQEPDEEKTEGGSEKQSLLDERSQGCYTEENIVSWERTLEVSAGSRWSVQGRRLRTLLLRLLAWGRVDKEAVSLNVLWQSLPEPHNSSMRAGLEAMLEHGVLQTVDNGDDGPQTVALNPERFEDVQALINRDVTEFWNMILESSEESGEQKEAAGDRWGRDHWTGTSPLTSRFGYSVSSGRGYEDRERQEILKQALTDPTHALPLEKVVNHIAWLIRINKASDERSDETITRWESDLDYLRRNYYSNSFPWPDKGGEMGS